MQLGMLCSWKLADIMLAFASLVAAICRVFVAPLKVASYNWNGVAQVCSSGSTEVLV